MRRTYKERGAAKSSNYRGMEMEEREANEITAEHRSRLRRHEMVELSDLFLYHDEEMKLERGLDW